MKIGRIKFKVKDFRTDSVRANEESSPTKIREDDLCLDYPDSCEEAVEIDCGSLQKDQHEIQCRFCWSSD